MSEDTDVQQVKIPVGNLIVNIFTGVINKFLSVRKQVTYPNYVSSVIQLADALALLYKLFPSEMRKKVNEAVGHRVDEFLSYELMVVRGSGNKLVFTVKVGDVEGTKAVDELLSRCRRVLFGIIDVLGEEKYDIGL